MTEDDHPQSPIDALVVARVRQLLEEHSGTPTLEQLLSLPGFANCTAARALEALRLAQQPPPTESGPELYEAGGGSPVRLVTRTKHDQQHCVTVLRALLARAERGEFKEFAFAATDATRDGAGHMVWTRSSFQQRLIGQVDALHALLVQQLLGRISSGQP